MKANDYIANFDSASAMVRALAAYLHGRDFPGLGQAPPIDLLAAAVNALPRNGREFLYTWSGALEAVPPEKLGQLKAEAISEWIVSGYPERPYPVVMVGSSNGAAVHLGAALGAPWLPQTLFIPVKRTGVHPDEVVADMEWGKEPGRLLLDANPELQLHHMHDPNQDRLMIQGMTYFRVKRRRLGEQFERFLEERLAPGGTILLIECEQAWPTVKVGDRHYFQAGAMGGLEPEEYLHGSAQVTDLLERYQSHRRTWDPLAPDGESPEAEWGFEPSMRSDVEETARRHGFRLVRLVFEKPEDLSPVIADLYQWWYEQRGLPANRLVIESFIVLEPYWMLRTGSIPFWAKFSVEPSAVAVDSYLDERAPFEKIFVMFFSQGTESAGLSTIDRWRRIIDRAQRRGGFLGVDTDKFPLDFGTFVRYYTSFKETIPARYPLPGSLTIDDVAAFMASRGDQYKVRWVEEDLTAPGAKRVGSNRAAAHASPER